MDVPNLSYADFEVGFGFDPRTNDYMVVRIAFPCTSELLLSYKNEVVLDQFRNYRILVEVYSLSTDSWRLISNNACLPPSTYLTNRSKPRTCLNGCLHFTAQYCVTVEAAIASEAYCGSVLAFDLRDQVFREMIPNNMIRLRRQMDEVDTCICRGSLALLHYYINEDPERARPRERYCCIWVMKEYGVVDSWVKQFTVEIHHLNVLGFTKNCQPILRIEGAQYSWEQELSSYDPQNQQATKLGIHCRHHLEGIICVDAYRENLVLLSKQQTLVPKLMEDEDGKRKRKRCSHN
ncbi:hypothetical protein FH972_007446 [Carpinus fangiana]|uniref:F-box associated beta-propeller type 1 domain-containing protein n=1 Tax=Carpinus fangiana TaxID=176857 RepID=A0A5N6QVH1_9ROSI|nr:hypothetical protein FH972_007446 [Carpinus fangiana]